MVKTVVVQSLKYDYFCTFTVLNQILYVWCSPSFREYFDSSSFSGSKKVRNMIRIALVAAAPVGVLSDIPVHCLEKDILAETNEAVWEFQLSNRPTLATTIGTYFSNCDIAVFQAS